MQHHHAEEDLFPVEQEMVDAGWAVRRTTTRADYKGSFGFGNDKWSGRINVHKATYNRPNKVYAFITNPPAVQDDSPISFVPNGDSPTSFRINFVNKRMYTAREALKVVNEALPKDL